MSSCANYPGRRQAALFAVKAAKIIPLGAPARGKELYAPAEELDNYSLVIYGDRIIDITRSPPCRPIDYGDCAILPPLANAHTHLQLSWLAGKTQWHRGFVPWLKSLIPHILPAARVSFGTQKEHLSALRAACAVLAGSLAGDIGGTLPRALTAVHAEAVINRIDVTHFCEWFGFAPQPLPWPERCKDEMDTKIMSVASPCGHALYSTDMAILAAAKQFCEKTDRVFTVHLAESPEETELLAEGRGALYELYKDGVLPDGWRPPGQTPLALALQNGLLNKNTLAVHCCQLTREEIRQFAATGAAICLCPRSNVNLAVGLPRVEEIIGNNILCCLGTDGLTSNEDVDIRKEAAFLRNTLDLPLRALWRMATVNGAAALARPNTALRINQQAKFSIWPLE